MEREREDGGGNPDNLQQMKNKSHDCSDGTAKGKLLLFRTVCLEEWSWGGCVDRRRSWKGNRCFASSNICSVRVEGGGGGFPISILHPFHNLLRSRFYSREKSC